MKKIVTPCSAVLTQLAKTVTAVLVGSKLLSRWGVWVGGSNGNKANLSPDGAGAGLSLATTINLFLSFLIMLRVNLFKYQKTVAELC